jgi:hypothetical protein
MLRAELGRGQDAWVLYQESGRVLRVLLHLAAAPDVAEDLVAEQREAARELASAVGVDGLVRMAGLWLEHESLVAAAGNRELALEVACMRLARWPAVKRIEGLLAGEDPPSGVSGGGGEPGASGERDRGRHASGSAGGRLSAALWEGGERRLAGVVERAEVSGGAGAVTLRFSSDDDTIAGFANGEARSRLEAACREVFGPEVSLRLETEAPAPDEAAADGPLMRQALDDPGVARVVRIMGGEVASVRPDGRPN